MAQCRLFSFTQSSRRQRYKTTEPDVVPNQTDDSESRRLPEALYISFCWWITIINLRPSVPTTPSLDRLVPPTQTHRPNRTQCHVPNRSTKFVERTQFAFCHTWSQSRTVHRPNTSRTTSDWTDWSSPNALDRNGSGYAGKQELFIRRGILMHKAIVRAAVTWHGPAVWQSPVTHVPLFRTGWVIPSDEEDDSEGRCWFNVSVPLNRYKTSLSWHPIRTRDHRTIRSWVTPDK
jgi:hypothetical protein